MSKRTGIAGAGARFVCSELQELFLGIFCKLSRNKQAHIRPIRVRDTRETKNHQQGQGHLSDPQKRFEDANSPHNTDSAVEKVTEGHYTQVQPSTIRRTFCAHTRDGARVSIKTLISHRSGLSTFDMYCNAGYDTQS
jgi:hypothetical protein